MSARLVSLSLSLAPDIHSEVRSYFISGANSCMTLTYRHDLIWVSVSLELQLIQQLLIRQVVLEHSDLIIFSKGFFFLEFYNCLARYFHSPVNLKEITFSFGFA